MGTQSQGCRGSGIYIPIPFPRDLSYGDPHRENLIPIPIGMGSPWEFPYQRRNRSGTGRDLYMIYSIS